MRAAERSGAADEQLAALAEQALGAGLQVCAVLCVCVCVWWRLCMAVRCCCGSSPVRHSVLP
jgi:hypothetical protein